VCAESGLDRLGASPSASAIHMKPLLDTPPPRPPRLTASQSDRAAAIIKRLPPIPHEVAMVEGSLEPSMGWKGQR
jgi:hypothetical protein